MAVFSPMSRYALYAEMVVARDRRGRLVRAVLSPDVPVAPELGEHLRRERQRLDHLAYFYLDDPTGFWRIALHNDSMLPDAIAETPSVKIPMRP